jgi:hypothetical protein
MSYLKKACPSIWFKKPAFIQPRTSLTKVADTYMHHAPPVIWYATSEPDVSELELGEPKPS